MLGACVLFSFHWRQDTSTRRRGAHDPVTGQVGNMVRASPACAETFATCQHQQPRGLLVLARDGVNFATPWPNVSTSSCVFLPAVPV